MMFQAFSTVAQREREREGERMGPGSLWLSPPRKGRMRGKSLYVEREREKRRERVFDWSLYQTVHTSAPCHVELDNVCYVIVTLDGYAFRCKHLIRGPFPSSLILVL